jgi:hypothetical protein
MLDDGAAEPAGEDAREFGAPLVGAHAARVPPVVRLDVVVVVHGHHGDPAKRGPSVMSYDVFGRVLRESSRRAVPEAGASRSMAAYADSLVPASLHPQRQAATCERPNAWLQRGLCPAGFRVEGVLIELVPCSRVHHRRLRLCPHPERRAWACLRPRAIDFPLPTPRCGSRPGTGRSMRPSVAHRVGGPGVGCADCDRRHHGGGHRRGPPASVGVRVWCPVDVSRRRPDSGDPRSEVQPLSLSLAEMRLLSPIRA